MTRVELDTQVAEKLHKLSQKTGKTVDETLLWLLDRYEQAIASAESKVGEDNDLSWTQEELEELLTPKKPLTGKEIVEGGFTGGWEDMGITDSVEWLKEQRAKRRAGKFS